MKRHFSTGLMLLFVASLTSLAGCAPAPNNSNGNVAVATPEPTPDNAAIATELTRIETTGRGSKTRWRTIRRIEADDVIIITPMGTGGKG
jgi:hypothetical protein